MNNLILKNRNQFQAFPSHLVEPSPWPIFVSFSLLYLAIAGVLYMHGYPNGLLLLTLGLVVVVSGMGLWFKDIVIEATLLGHHTKQVRKGITTGVVLFIVSEVFAFLSVFWAFFHSSLSPTIEIGGVWPPQGITALNPFAIPLLNTFLLLSSGAFVTFAHHALIKGDRANAISATFYTILLAIIFTALQYVEYTEAGFTISDSVFGSAFYSTTGLHGLHVIIGTIFLGVAFFRQISYHFTKQAHKGFEYAILYWHFVDVVWLFLFVAVYYWGGNN